MIKEKNNNTFKIARIMTLDVLFDYKKKNTTSDANAMIINRASAFTKSAA